MFNHYRSQQFKQYNKARSYLAKNPEVMIAVEKFLADYVNYFVAQHWPFISKDYDEASFLYPFWQNYPPDERGRQPKGDQFPWIEVGEHSLGAKLPRLLNVDFSVRDVGIPTGADQRFVLTSNRIGAIMKGLTDSVWLSVDIKSAGPRDDFDHAVMSHNQVSGDGLWEELKAGVKNTVLKAQGVIASHDFHCSVPPLYVLSDTTVAPVVSIVLKPVYRMLSLMAGKFKEGQPLGRVTIACIPNGLLLAVNPNYLAKYPGLLFPGKDDKTKNPLKVRARVSFPLLRKIAAWRVRDVYGAESG